MLSKILAVAAVATLAVFATPAQAVSCALNSVQVGDVAFNLPEAATTYQATAALTASTPITLHLEEDPVGPDATSTSLTVFVDDVEYDGITYGNPFVASGLRDASSHTIKVINTASTTVTITDIDGSESQKTIASCQFSYNIILNSSS